LKTCIFIAFMMCTFQVSLIAQEVIAPKKPMTWAEEEKLIAKYKSYLKTSSNDERPPLISVSAEGQLWFVETFLKHGEKIDEEESRGGNALSAAILNIQEDTVDLLIKKGANVNIVYSGEMQGVQPIILAAQAGDEVILSRLIKSGANVNCVVPDNITPRRFTQPCFMINWERQKYLSRLEQSSSLTDFRMGVFHRKLSLMHAL
jgi:ankyrin repeat protein